MFFAEVEGVSRDRGGVILGLRDSVMPQFRGVYFIMMMIMMGSDFVAVLSHTR
jgi:hypothetical protein